MDIVKIILICAGIVAAGYFTPELKILGISFTWIGGGGLLFIIVAAALGAWAIAMRRKGFPRPKGLDN